MEGTWKVKQGVMYGEQAREYAAMPPPMGPGFDPTGIECVEVWTHYEIVDGRKRDWLEFLAYGGSGPPLWMNGEELHEQRVLLHTYRMEYPGFWKLMWVQLALFAHELSRRFRKRAE